MKAVILAGGLGTRLSEETQVKPKPMVEIGGKPILWHIMKIYSAYGVKEFIICLGYKGAIIKDFFARYRLTMSDVTFDMAANTVEYHKNYGEDWRVTLVDTGEGSMFLLKSSISRALMDSKSGLPSSPSGTLSLGMSALIIGRISGRITLMTTSLPFSFRRAVCT